MSLLDRLVDPGPKRVLALDGGGIRGVVALVLPGSRRSCASAMAARIWCWLIIST